MKQEDLKILQLGKFYPIRGGVEKVMYDLMLGLSARKVWGIQRSGFFNGRGKWAKGFENQMV